VKRTELLKLVRQSVVEAYLVHFWGSRKRVILAAGLESVENCMQAMCDFLAIRNGADVETAGVKFGSNSGIWRLGSGNWGLETRGWMGREYTSIPERIHAAGEAAQR
jgi:hypothetical protein